MLEVKNLSKTYGEGSAKVVALKDIHICVDNGEFVAITGPSGSGKSTLLNIIGGLDFQQYHLIPSLTALENVLLPLTFYGSGKEDENRAIEILRKVGLEKRAKHNPSQLSGGEQQRVAIARALINNCQFVLADEPTGNLDQNTGMEILNLFKQMNDEGHTILMVTHSPDIVSHAKRIIALRDGEIV